MYYCIYREAYPSIFSVGRADGLRSRLYTLSEESFTKASNYYCIEHLRDSRVLVEGSLCDSYEDFIECLRNFHIPPCNFQEILEHTC